MAGGGIQEKRADLERRSGLKDIQNVILVYWQEPGREEFGNAIFIMLMLSVLFQLFVIYIQNKKVPRKMLAEALLCVVGLKPGYVRAKRA